MGVSPYDGSNAAAQRQHGGSESHRGGRACRRSLADAARVWPVVSGGCHDRMLDETLGGRDAKRCGAAHFVVRRNDGNNRPPALVRRVERVGTRGGTARPSVRQEHTAVCKEPHDGGGVGNGGQRSTL